MLVVRKTTLIDWGYPYDPYCNIRYDSARRYFTKVSAFLSTLYLPVSQTKTFPSTIIHGQPAVHQRISTTVDVVQLSRIIVPNSFKLFLNYFIIVWRKNWITFSAQPSYKPHAFHHLQQFLSTQKFTFYCIFNLDSIYFDLNLLFTNSAIRDREFIFMTLHQRLCCPDIVGRSGCRSISLNWKQPWLLGSSSHLFLGATDMANESTLSTTASSNFPFLKPYLVSRKTQSPSKKYSSRLQESFSEVSPPCLQFISSWLNTKSSGTMLMRCGCPPSFKLIHAIIHGFKGCLIIAWKFFYHRLKITQIICFHM